MHNYVPVSETTPSEVRENQKNRKEKSKKGNLTGKINRISILSIVLEVKTKISILWFVF